MIWNNKFQLKSKLRYKLNMEKIQIKNKYFSPSIFWFGTKIKWLKSTTCPCTIYKCYRCSGFLTKELRVANYELRVTIYCTRYELLFIARGTSYYFLHELRVSFCILQELRVTISCMSDEFLLQTSCYLLHELRVNFYVKVTSYCL